MNDKKKIASNIFGILAGLVFLIVAIQSIQLPASHKFWSIGLIIIAILQIGLNISLMIGNFKER